MSKNKKEIPAAGSINIRSFRRTLTERPDYNKYPVNEKKI